MINYNIKKRAIVTNNLYNSFLNWRSNSFGCASQDATSKLGWPPLLINVMEKLTLTLLVTVANPLSLISNSSNFDRASQSKYKYMNNSLNNNSRPSPGMGVRTGCGIRMSLIWLLKNYVIVVVIIVIIIIIFYKLISIRNRVTSLTNHYVMGQEVFMLDDLFVCWIEVKLFQRWKRWNVGAKKIPEKVR